MPDTDLLELADRPLAALLSDLDAKTTTVLATVLQRLLDSDDESRLTISAFSSAL